MGNENGTLVSLSMGQTPGQPMDQDLISHLTASSSVAQLCVSVELYTVNGVTFEILYKDNIGLRLSYEQVSLDSLVYTRKS